MSRTLCRLCELKPAIKGSHVNPAFVFRALKSDSATGYMRLASAPNRRYQDGDKHELLCEDCEQRFSQRESKVSTLVFQPYHESDRDEFDYGDWLHYFITSLSWRTLVLDLADPTTTSRIPQPVLLELRTATSMMRQYLLGENGVAAGIRHHLYLFTNNVRFPVHLSDAGPHFMVRRSIGDYTTWHPDGYSAVQRNLLGFFCFTPLRENPTDTWENTEIHPAGGSYRRPRMLDSWVVRAWFDDIREFSQSRERMSDKQREVVDNATINSNAASLRFRETDRQLRSGTSGLPT